MCLSGANIIAEWILRDGKSQKIEKILIVS